MAVDNGIALDTPTRWVSRRGECRNPKDEWRTKRRSKMALMRGGTGQSPKVELRMSNESVNGCDAQRDCGELIRVANAFGERVSRMFFEENLARAMGGKCF